MSGILSVVITGDALIDSNASLKISVGEKYSTIQSITTSDPAARDGLAKIKSKSSIFTFWVLSKIEVDEFDSEDVGCC